jgi:hypothetical protein
LKLKIRSDDASTRREHGWPEMGDWLAQLRDDSSDDSRGEPPGDDRAGADGADYPRSEALAQADVRAEARVAARAEAEAEAGAQAGAHAEADAHAGATERAVIGDQLRMPIMWCEMGSCISWYTDPAAVGEADTRARAIGAGWRIDALGRLACPQCQQTDPWFWASCQVVPWDRRMASVRTTQAAAPGDGTADSVAMGTSHDPGRAARGYPPVSRAERELHHNLPNGHTVPAGRFADSPAGTLIRAAWPWNSARARQARGGRQAATSPSQ